MSQQPILGILGGTGLYAMAGLEDQTEQQIDTPFGAPSSPVITGRLEGTPVAFIARHDLGHVLLPSELNYRANIYALKMLGVERVLSVSACGSLREDYAPGDIVVPDQLFDFTRKRKATFFGEGLAAHISVAKPFCPDFSAQVYGAVNDTGARVHQGGTYITVEGPRFSTRGESDVFRTWGMSIIGMTTAPEAFLALEAEMCYSVMAHVTDYDVWHTTQEPVSAEMVLKTIHQNMQIAGNAIRQLAASYRAERDCDCPTALGPALTSDPARISPETRQKLSLLVSKYLDR